MRVALHLEWPKPLHLETITGEETFTVDLDVDVPSLEDYVELTEAAAEVISQVVTSAIGSVKRIERILKDNPTPEELPPKPTTGPLTMTWGGLTATPAATTTLSPGDTYTAKIDTTIHTD